jgi:hypothetical protein
MTTEQTTYRTTSGMRARGRAVTVAGAITLAVVAVSIGTWQGARPHAAPDVSSPPLASTVGSVAPSEGMATAVRTAPPTVYIAESQARAEALLAGIEEANRIRESLGVPPLTPQLVWFDSVEAEVQFWATREAQGSPAGSGLAALSVIDLRRAAGAALNE